MTSVVSNTKASKLAAPIKGNCSKNKKKTDIS